MAHPRNPGYKPADHWASCDRCGSDYMASELKKEWNGLWVCRGCWEPRQEQDFVTGRTDKIVGDEPRRQSGQFENLVDDQFIEQTEINGQFTFDNGTTEPSLGDTLGGDTSNSVGTVQAIELTSGAWADGDAVGIMKMNKTSGNDFGSPFQENVDNDTTGDNNVLRADAGSWEDLFQGPLETIPTGTHHNTTDPEDL